MVADSGDAIAGSISALSSATPQTQQREAAAARQGLGPPPPPVHTPVGRERLSGRALAQTALYR